MKMFNHSNSTWVRYSEYEWKQDENGKLYLTACADAQPAIYDPLKEYQQLVLDALYIGRLGMKQEQDCRPHLLLWTMKRCICQRIVLSKRKRCQPRNTLLYSSHLTKSM